jgi:molybdopterin synthase catalytic subunit
VSFLSAEPIDPVALLAAFSRRAERAGAIVSFTGVVRGEDGVTELWLDHHPALTEASIAAIAADTRARVAVDELLIVHRIGSVGAGDAVVFVAAAASHRRAAFDAVDQAMDRLKTDAILWKRETRPDGTRWVEARDQDHADRARWEEQG